MIRIILPPTLLLPLLLAACGQSDEERLKEAANQSTPEAAQVLNEAAEQGVDPQTALNKAAEAQAQNTSSGELPPPAQARPNSAQDPNPPQPGQPPEKITTNSQ